MKHLFNDIPNSEKQRILEMHKGGKTVISEQKIDYNPKKLKFGDRGDDVKKLQDKLMRNGFLKLKSGKPTGYFGNMTNSALARAEGKKPVTPIKKKVVEPIKKKVVEPIKNSKIEISPTINPDFKNKINFLQLKTNDTTSGICAPGQNECATFVNDFSNKIESVGDSAWLAYRSDTYLGPTIYSAFKSSENPLLTKEKINTIVNLWGELDKKGVGGVKNAKNNITEILNSIVPNGSKIPITLKIDDVVGLFYSGSKHTEEAFYEGGEKWFINKLPGKSIADGNLWGMNTHIGIVGAIKDGVPLIFHNVKGTVFSDPPQNLRIAWVKRKQ